MKQLAFVKIRPATRYYPKNLNENAVIIIIGR